MSKKRRSATTRNTTHEGLQVAALITVVVIGVLALCMLGGAFDPPKQSAQQFSEEMRAHIESGRAVAVSWIITSAKVDGKMIPELQQLGEFVGRVIKRNESVSPLTGRISRAFAKTQTGIMSQPGVNTLIVQAKDKMPTIAELSDPHSLTAYFIPESVAKTPGFSPCVMWNPTYKALIIHGRHWPSAYLASLVIHEAGHGLYDAIEHRPSAHAPGTSDSYIQEELDMHEVQSLVLDRETNGEYLKCVDTIVDDRPASWVPLDIMLSLTRQDLEKLDAAAGCPNPDLHLRRILCVDHMLTVAKRSIDKGRKPVREREMIRIYGWMTETFK